MALSKVLKQTPNSKTKLIEKKFALWEEEHRADTEEKGEEDEDEDEEVEETEESNDEDEEDDTGAGAGSNKMRNLIIMIVAITLGLVAMGGLGLLSYRWLCPREMSPEDREKASRDANEAIGTNKATAEEKAQPKLLHDKIMKAVKLDLEHEKSKEHKAKGDALKEIEKLKPDDTDNSLLHQIEQNDDLKKHSSNCRTSIETPVPKDNPKALAKDLVDAIKEYQDAKNAGEPNHKKKNEAYFKAMTICLQKEIAHEKSKFNEDVKNAYDKLEEKIQAKYGDDVTLDAFREKLLNEHDEPTFQRMFANGSGEPSAGNGGDESSAKASPKEAPAVADPDLAPEGGDESSAKASPKEAPADADAALDADVDAPADAPPADVE